MQQLDQPGKSLLARRLIARHRVARILAGTHEAVSRAIVRNRLVFLARGLHCFDRAGNSGANARVVARVEPIHRSVIGGDIRRPWTIEHKGRRQIPAVGCEGEGLAPAPTEADDRDLAVGGGQMLAIVGRGVQVGENHTRIQAGHSFDRCILAGKLAGAAAVRAKARSAGRERSR
jgi:hypothetical protein